MKDRSWRKAAVPIPPPSAPQEVVGCDQPLQRLPSVAAAGGDGLAGGRVQVDGRWRRGLGRSWRTGWDAALCRGLRAPTRCITGPSRLKSTRDSTHRWMKEGAQVTGRSDALRKMGYQGEQNGLTKWSGVNLELKSFFR